jgi:hypothetical protein
MRKVSTHTVEVAIGLARSVANGTTKFPFVGYCADLMEKMLEEIKETRKAQEKQQEPNTNLVTDPELAKRFYIDGDGNVGIGS